MPRRPRAPAPATRAPAPATRAPAPATRAPAPATRAPAPATRAPAPATRAPAPAITQALEKSQEQGYILRDHLQDVAEQDGLDAADVVTLEDHLLAHNVDIVDDADDAREHEEADRLEAALDARASEPTGADVDATHTYLRAIAAVPLLTRAQELDLARRVEQGDADATRQFVVANLRLVVNVAKKYRGRAWASLT